MQDQPRYEAYESSKLFKDGLSSRPLIEGTVPRGYLRDDAQLYTGKMTKAQAGASGAVGAGQNRQSADNATPQGNANTNSAMAQGVAVASSASSAMAQGGRNAGTAVSHGQGASGANAQRAGASNEADDVVVFPFPVTTEVVARGKERYEIFCVVCHGATGEGDGMIVRRGYRKPPSYYTDDLRKAPVGHYFDVVTNGWGAMPNYAAQIPVTDRWAIIAYIRALQLSRPQIAGESAPTMKTPAVENPKNQTGGQK